MEDYFVCKKLSHSNNNFCSLYGHWDSIRTGKCSKCTSKGCKLCYHKETSTLKDGKFVATCDICMRKNKFNI